MNPRAARHQAQRDRLFPRPPAVKPARELTYAETVCASKRRHPDELTARAVAACEVEAKPWRTALFVYACMVCRGWHLTRSPNGAPIVIGNPVAERHNFRSPLDLIKSTGRLTTYFDCAHAERDEQKFLHAQCLDLEAKGRLKRYRTHARSIIWTTTEGVS